MPVDLLYHNTNKKAEERTKIEYWKVVWNEIDKYVKKQIKKYDKK